MWSDEKSDVIPVRKICIHKGIRNMKKILILTCSTGEGHNSAARAIEAALTKKGFSCELADPVSFQSERMKHLVASLYNGTIRKAPAIFGVVYKLGDFYCSTKLPSPVYWANAHYSESLKEYILKNKFDMVICTHLYGMEAMTALRKKSGFSIPCYGVLTDYVCIPFLEETDLTGYFVSNEEAKAYLVKKGISADRIVVSGIPVDERFRDHPEKAEARRELNIPDEKKVFLIMTGGIGCENMESLCDKMVQGLTNDDLVIVLTGKNQDLKDKLDEKYGTIGKVRTVSFTRQVASFMSAADVMLSKPGGLSSTEAAVANVPLVHIHAIPGCETYNARFFSEHGMSCAAQSEKEAVACARRLAYDENAAREMQAKQRMYINPDAVNMILREVNCV